MKMWTFNYTPALEKRLTNVQSLSRGTGCNVLECIVAHDNHTLIAKQWRKGEPYAYDAIIRFPGARFYKDNPPPDFHVQNEGTIFILYPLTTPATDWCNTHLPKDAMRWAGTGYVIEHRYVGTIVRDMIADGLKAKAA